MVSITHGNHKNVSDFQYNFEHIVLVSKYRFKVFKNSKTQKVVADAFRETEMQYKIKIKEFSFGDDYAHVHMEVNVPNNLSMEQVVQILKSHSASKIFKEMPNFTKRYPKKHFWGGQYSNSSVGPVGENIIQNYIRRQDVSFEPFLQHEEEGHQMKLQFN
ncbi:MAG: IS200/IS605 family transposase [Candidatus Marsarchaeota archaeon]|nr:IS200/IS605 family transposase [Candidatus Marsarchaeota archaeon]MCL5413133.1 IS200/IS605 family transposase [Candidatus Marsarchaeota archaeon]